MDNKALLSKVESGNGTPRPVRGYAFSYKARVMVVALVIVSAVMAAIWVTVDFDDDEGDSEGDRDYWVETMSPSFHIVESIPVSEYDLEPISSSLATHDAEIKMLNSALGTVDVTAMYWNLLPAQDQKNCNETNGGLSYDKCIELGGDR